MRNLSRTRRIIYGTAAGIGILAGAAGLAGAVTPKPSSNPPAATSDASSAARTGRNHASDHQDESERDSSYTSSIRLPQQADSGHESAASESAEAAKLKQLAKVSQSDAERVATAAAPGKVTSSELTNEDGNVVYQVVVTNGNTSTEVMVDAGNGKVLQHEVDHEDGNESADAPDTANATDTADAPSTAPAQNAPTTTPTSR